jgi:hypothetical protein
MPKIGRLSFIVDQNNEVTGDIKTHQTENIQNNNQASSHVWF